MTTLQSAPVSKSVADEEIGLIATSDQNDAHETAFPVIGIGASAGGLQALNAFFDATTNDSGIAFAVVQHLDPTHESFMVELLQKRTPMSIHQVIDGMKVEKNNIYLIPPGEYLTIKDNHFTLTLPKEGSKVFLPFDNFLRSLAVSLTDNCGCVILSGSGTDGTLGAKAVKQHGGLVIVQNPEEATFDNMPRSALATGLVDAALPAKLIPSLLNTYFQQKNSTNPMHYNEPDSNLGECLNEAIDILKDTTGNDFIHYKSATLLRRLERRMAICNIDTPAEYLSLLRTCDTEPRALVSDLLINVTSFFRDANLFDQLNNSVITKLIEDANNEDPIRIWVAGCSSGEEVYSLIIMFHETASKLCKRLSLQIFATDIDHEAISTARNGYYGKLIEADVSHERLDKFFTKKGDGYLINSSIRQPVTFAVHNILSDPPYSRLNLLVCRNLLIYIQQDAQESLYGMFQYALKDFGYIFLGSSESLGSSACQYEAISPNARIFRLINRKANNGFTLPSIGSVISDGLLRKQARSIVSAKPIGIEDLAHSAIFKKYAPAAIAINKRREAVFFDGPVDKFLKLAEGNIRFNVPTMARENLSHAIRSVIQQVETARACATITADLVGPSDTISTVTIECLPLLNTTEDLLLLTFVEGPAHSTATTECVEPSKTTELEQTSRELKALRIEYQTAISDRDNDREIIGALQEEYLSMREEFQSTSEELETSREELQSTNEELTTLNNHLRQTLDAQRAISDDLHNILNASEASTIILDSMLNVKLFTPKSSNIANLRSIDVGRPFTELTMNICDETLQSDLFSVSKSHRPTSREILSNDRLWYTRKVLPYWTHAGGFGGFVITYSDITEIKLAELLAQQANNAKSAFLATMSHELRTPLNSILGFAQVALEKNKTSCQSAECADYNGYILESGNHLLSLINDILDISKIEAGKMAIHQERISVVAFSEHVNSILKIRSEEKSLSIKTAICEDAEYVWADMQALKQIVYNLVANAIEFTPNGGRITLKSECAVNGGIDIAVIDNGIGISSKDLLTLMVPFHQVDNSLNRKHGGSGLGLSLVKGLIELHGGRVSITSIEGSGTSVVVHFPPEPLEPTSLPISIVDGAPREPPTVSSAAQS